MGGLCTTTTEELPTSDLTVTGTGITCATDDVVKVFTVTDQQNIKIGTFSKFHDKYINKL